MCTHIFRLIITIERTLDENINVEPVLRCLGALCWRCLQLALNIGDHLLKRLPPGREGRREEGRARSVCVWEAKSISDPKLGDFREQAHPNMQRDTFQAIKAK